MEKAMIVSNNPLVWVKYPGCVKIEGTYKEVLIKVRDLIHQGNSLISHPLSGSIKPNETPYKSVLLKVGKGGLDYQSLLLIESAIEVADKFYSYRRNWSDQVIRDFQVIDEDLLDSALEALAPDLIIEV
ncbi:MAG: GrdX family protein [Bacillota bacterium]